MGYEQEPAFEGGPVAGGPRRVLQFVANEEIAALGAAAAVVVDVWVCHGE
jgi:hypothetical protein